ncbi:selenocysteine-specific translation elongation factor [Pseudoflavonifractor sp. 524-17]|uniref:selenocysteine-specific translation elongation factor n=1 Tax=Pseudoflavonifractor sp. 524-17 TaxID=2304577 RepID=UPI001379AB47|nr:selenocysteine-specific translation elongation factor [Pseudoflavonifractor sp. 524-17]NCE65026.1 selenocysteine-specific translation elongation factor [Pseudoflavonifractor sp. 524-17]
MKHIIIGTAGHVDHGKTCLTWALTGVDTDRLKEEQKRGITIEIGFAQLTLPNGQTASIIDVPGHEKFIRNMLVGAAGMDVVLMVIAADEGFMPQTREHLGILSLLGVQNGIIVLTKADMVEEEWLEAIQEEARETVQGTFLQDAPMIAVSSYTGQGIQELKELIVRLVDGAQQRNQDRPFRLPVDRVFSVDGFGTVVTGTLLEGSMALGEEVCVYPAGRKARIRGLQNHDQPEERTTAGMRVAVNLSGIEKAHLKRGDTIAKPGSMVLSRQMDVQLMVLRDAPYSIKNDTRLHFHHGSRELICKCVLLGRDTLEPGETGFAQLRFQEAVAVKNGDHYVVRFFSPTVTVGGGVILNASPGRHKRADPQVLEGLAARASGSSEKQVTEALRQAGAGLPKRHDLAKSAGLTEAELEEALAELIEQGQVVELGGRFASHDTVDALWDKAVKFLGDYHRAQPLQPGMNRGEFRNKLLPSASPAAVDALVGYYAAHRGLRLEGPTIALPDFQVVWNSFYTGLKDQLLDQYGKAALAPDNLDDILAPFGKKQEGARQVVTRLLYDGALVALTPQILLRRDFYQKAVAGLLSLFERKPELLLAEFRDTLGVSRKYALALLEYWDSAGITRKTGDVRTLLKRPEG